MCITGLQLKNTIIVKVVLYCIFTRHMLCISTVLAVEKYRFCISQWLCVITDCVFCKFSPVENCLPVGRISRLKLKLVESVIGSAEGLSEDIQWRSAGYN